MKQKEERKRSISILTVLLWLILIIVMTVITVSGMNKENALNEDDTKSIIKIKVEGADDNPEIDELYRNLKPYTSITYYSKSKEYFSFKEKDSEGNYVYEADKATVSLNANRVYIRINEIQIEEKKQKMCIKDEYIKWSSKNEFYVNVSTSELSEIEFVSIYYDYVDININVTVEGLENKEDLEKVYSNASIKISSNSILNPLNCFLRDHTINGVTNIVIKEKLFCETDIFSIIYYDSNVDLKEYKPIVVYEINEEEFSGTYTISKENVDIKVRIIYYPSDTYIKQNISWSDKEKGKAILELGYTSTGRSGEGRGITANFCPILYSVKLNEVFEISSEYENDEKWSILENSNSEKVNYFGVAEDVFYEFFGSNSNYSNSTGKEFVYVKDTKTIYWCEKDVQIGSGSKKINIVYMNYNNLEENIELDSSNESNLCTIGYVKGEGDYREIYNIISPKLKFSHVEESKLKIEKIVEGEKGARKYYVGLFIDDTSFKTDEIYAIETINGYGSVVIDMSERKEYYVYEVDELGNKISDEKIKYNKNKLEFNSFERETKIDTDKSVISSVMSEKYDEGKIINRKFETDINNSVGTGETDYNDNVLNVIDTYQEKIVISSKVKKYTVEYIAEEGGKLDGNIEELVNEREYPETVPSIAPNEGYEFVRWEVEKDGKRVEVIPNEYEILEDTVFYAIFEKIPVEESVDTSDINVGVYIVISLVAIVGIIGIVYFLIKHKKENK